jgi:hypothetical protein
MLLVKNISPYGNGNVSGGTLEFELTLKGSGWLDELRRLGVMHRDSLAHDASLRMNMQAGTAHHSTSVKLKIAGQ